MVYSVGSSWLAMAINLVPSLVINTWARDAPLSSSQLPSEVSQDICVNTCSSSSIDEWLCLLVIIGITERGRMNLVAVEDGYRKSEASWMELLTVLKDRGLNHAPKLAGGDGASGFWKVLSKVR